MACPNNFRPWTESEIRKFKEMYFKGTNFKRMSLELNRTRKALLEKRRALGWPSRRGKDKLHSIRVRVDKKLYEGMRKRMIERQQPMAYYIRYLIQRDVGLM